MSKARYIFVAALFVFGWIGQSASPAPAGTFAGPLFTCEMQIPSIPSNYGAVCLGTVEGAGVSEDQPYACAADPCDLRMEFVGTDFCATVNEIPELGFAVIDIYVDDRLVGTANATRVGTQMTFFPSEHSGGEALWIPHGLIPRCENPAPLTVTLAGTFYSNS